MGSMKIGSIALIAGLIIAVAGAFGLSEPWFAWVLVVLGLVIGFLNVSGKEANRFLIASIGLMLSASSVAALPYIGGTVTAVLGNIVTLLAPAVLITALQSLFQTVTE